MKVLIIRKSEISTEYLNDFLPLKNTTLHDQVT